MTKASVVHRVCVNLKDYILGRRVELSSPLDQQAAERAIRSGIKRGLNPFYTGVVGWCRFRRVGLRWATAMWGNGFQPVFSGKLRSEFGGTTLRARFGAPLFLLLFFSIWYLLLTIMLFSGVAGYINGDGSGPDLLVAVLAPTGMMAVPMAFHFIFSRNANKHYESIISVLGETAQFKVQASPKLS